MAPLVRPGEARPDLYPADVSPMSVVADDAGTTAARLLAVDQEELADDPAIGHGPAAQAGPALAEKAAEQVARVGEGFLEAGLLQWIGGVKEGLEDREGAFIALDQVGQVLGRGVDQASLDETLVEQIDQDVE